MSLFGEAAILFQELMGDDDFRSPAVLLRSNSAFDQVTGTSVETVTSVDCFAIVAPVTSRGAGGPVTFSTIAVMTAEPALNDQLQVGGTKYTVKEVQAIAPNGTAFAWKAVVE